MGWIFFSGGGGLLVGIIGGCVLGYRLALVPDLFVRWHHDHLRACWRRICGRKGGRPKIDPKLIALIRRLSRENPLWGAPHIHGELKWLGYHIAQSTVAKYMIPRRGRPKQSWKTFVHNHKDVIAAIDMLCVCTASLECLYAVVVLSLGRRIALHVEVTDHPTALWLARQITEAFPWDTAPEFLVRDNDGAYGAIFRRRVRAMGIRDHPTMPHSPWQNGYVERLIGSIRRECLDHIAIRDENHLRNVLREYVEYYNSNRTHLSLAKDSPLHRAIETDGALVSYPVLGGLHHRYVRIPSQ